MPGILDLSGPDMPHPETLAAQAPMPENVDMAVLSPILLGIGIGLYFSWPYEPDILAPLLPGLGLALLALILAWRNAWAWLRIVAQAGAIVAGGFLAATLSTAHNHTVMLDRPQPTQTIEGRLLDVTTLPQGVRLLLDDLAVPSLPNWHGHARLFMMTPPDRLPSPGARIRLSARLVPPAGPAAPGAFDYRQWCFFNGIAAVGNAYAPLLVTDPAATPEDQTAMALLRQAIARRVAVTLNGDPAAIAVALSTGAQQGISKPVTEAMRDSGLMHILSVSGLHIALVAGLVFFSLRALLALIPFIALRWNTRKIAALAALPPIIFYTLLVGAPFPAQRSLLMAALVLVAILVGRRALSLRVIALTASAILCVQPHALTHVGFQLSFAAATALVVVYNAMRRIRAQNLRRHGSDHRPFWQRPPFDIALTSLVAGLATAPLTLFHFQQISWYGVAANVLAVPLTSFVIMPALTLALLAMPLGLEHIPLMVTGWGIEGMVRIAHLFADMPGAVTRLPALPLASLLTMLTGGLFLCLMPGRWRLLGVPVILMALGIGLTMPRPDMLIAEDGSLIGLRLADGRLALSRAPSHSQTADHWRRREAVNALADWPDISTDPLLSCQDTGCLYHLRDRAIWLADTDQAPDCARLDMVVAPQSDHTPCPHLPAVTRSDLARHGAYAVYIGPFWGLRWNSADPYGPTRPWQTARQ